MRLQVLHLPAPANEHPFVLVIDKVRDGDMESFDLEALNRRIGSRTVVWWDGEVEIG